MSLDILREMDFLVCSVVLGIGITFVYDWLRILRRVIRHNDFWVSAEDFFFWIFSAATSFYMLYTENNGVLRWFAVCGAAGGMFFYKWLCSRYFVKVMVFVFGKIGNVVGKMLHFFLKPLVYSADMASGMHKKCIKKVRLNLRFFKKKLTGGLKLVKLILFKR